MNRKEIIIKVLNEPSNENRLDGLEKIISLNSSPISELEKNDFPAIDFMRILKLANDVMGLKRDIELVNNSLDVLLRENSLKRLCSHRSEIFYKYNQLIQIKSFQKVKGYLNIIQDVLYFLDKDIDELCHEFKVLKGDDTVRFVGIYDKILNIDNSKEQAFQKETTLTNRGIALYYVLSGIYERYIGDKEGFYELVKQDEWSNDTGGLRSHRKIYNECLDAYGQSSSDYYKVKYKKDFKIAQELIKLKATMVATSN